MQNPNLLYKKRLVIFICRGTEIHKLPTSRQRIAMEGHSERRKSTEINTRLFKHGMLSHVRLLWKHNYLLK